MLGNIDALPEELGKAEHLKADTGDFSKDSVDACERAGVELVIASRRQPLRESFEKPSEPTNDPTPVEKMAHRRKTPEARALYALRKRLRRVFGIIKSVPGLRQFCLRGLENVCGEWSLVNLAWNLNRMFVLAAA